MTWPAGKDYDAQEECDKIPAMLLVHGFAASVEQWERLVHSLRSQNVKASRNGNGDGGEKDTTPPIFAVDLLGFGHSEKPSLSYTQYLWEAQVVDFCVEVMEAAPVVLVGNSIGGGLSAGAAASLGKDICKGLVLCNTAGVLKDPDDYEGYTINTAAKNVPRLEISTFTEAAMEGNPNEAPYGPVPLFGNNVLDLFGRAVIRFIYPQIDQRLSLIYGNRLANADEAVSYAIKQSAKGPGSANVIGAGQKLAENRPLNEVLRGFPTLVVMGLEDQVSSPAVAKGRAELFEKLATGSSSSEEAVSVVVERIEKGGHCPHDEVPDAVASALLKWFSSSTFLGQVVDEGAEETALMKEVVL
jgi:pimeloyl-ACP methyl ester carboxylesterase